MLAYARIIPEGHELVCGLEDPKNNKIVYTSKTFGKHITDEIARRQGLILGWYVVPVRN
jgi:hypothetical protein